MRHFVLLGQQRFAEQHLQVCLIAQPLAFRLPAARATSRPDPGESSWLASPPSARRSPGRDDLRRQPARTRRRFVSGAIPTSCLLRLIPKLRFVTLAATLRFVLFIKSPYPLVRAISHHPHLGASHVVTTTTNSACVVSPMQIAFLASAKLDLVSTGRFATLARLPGSFRVAIPLAHPNEYSRPPIYLVQGNGWFQGGIVRMSRRRTRAPSSTTCAAVESGLGSDNITLLSTFSTAR